MRNKLQQYQGIDCLYSKLLIFPKGNYLWTTVYIRSWHKRFVGFMEQYTCRDSIECATHPDHRNAQIVYQILKLNLDLKFNPFIRQYLGKNPSRVKKMRVLDLCLLFFLCLVSKSNFEFLKLLSRDINTLKKWNHLWSNTYQRCLPTYKNSHDLAKETETKNSIAMKTQIVTLQVKTKLQILTLKKKQSPKFILPCKQRIERRFRGHKWPDFVE